MATSCLATVCSATRSTWQRAWSPADDVSINDACRFYDDNSRKQSSSHARMLLRSFSDHLIGRIGRIARPSVPCGLETRTQQSTGKPRCVQMFPRAGLTCAQIFGLKVRDQRSTSSHVKSSRNRAYLACMACLRAGCGRRLRGVRLLQRRQ